MKKVLLRGANRLAAAAGLRVVPAWQLDWSYAAPEAQPAPQDVTRRRATRLNVGCGRDVRPGWLNIDARPLQEESDTFLCCDLLQIQHYIEPGSVKEILAQDILEHFSWRDVSGFVSTLAGLLEPNGVITVQSPDLHAITKGMQAGELSEADGERLLYGDQTYAQNAHRCAFTHGLLESRLRNANLIVESIQTDGYNVRAVARLPR